MSTQERLKALEEKIRQFEEEQSTLNDQKRIEELEERLETLKANKSKLL